MIAHPSSDHYYRLGPECGQAGVQLLRRSLTWRPSQANRVHVPEMIINLPYKRALRVEPRVADGLGLGPEAEALAQFKFPTAAARVCGMPPRGAIQIEPERNNALGAGKRVRTRARAPRAAASPGRRTGRAPIEN